MRLENYGQRKTDRATPHEDKNHCFVWFIFICFYFEQGKYRKLSGINWLLSLQCRPLSLAWPHVEFLLALPDIRSPGCVSWPLVDLVALCILGDSKADSCVCSLPEQVTLFAYSDLLLFTKEEEPGRCDVLRNPLYLQSVKLQEGKEDLGTPMCC